MSPELLSLSVYAAAATGMAAVIASIGYFWKKISWNPLEFLFVYLPWCMLAGLAIYLFGDVHNAVATAKMNHKLFFFQSLVGGLIGGLTLLPRLLMPNAQLNRYAMLLFSAMITGMLYIKFILIMYIIIPTPK